MMKNVLFSVAAVTVLLLSGCSQKNPVIDDSTTQRDVVINTNTDTNSNMNGMNNTMDIDQIISNLKGDLGSIYFDFDSFSIRPDMQSVVSNDVNVLNRQEARDLTIKIEGNCDEWGTDEYNMALGLKRAATVKQALISRGVNPNKIQTVSYGKNNPVCTEKTKSCWSKNRRVDFNLLTR